MLTIKKLGFLLSFSLPLLNVWAHYYGGTGILLFFPGVFAYIIVPFLDNLIGNDAQNIAKNDLELLTQDRYFDILVYSHVYIQLLSILWGAFVIYTEPFSLLPFLALLINQGFYASTIINVAHELGHRQSKVAQWHARFGLIMVAYGHFIVEHNKGHHVHVATPLDPATSKKNQTVYAFWLQTVIGSFNSAWQLEKKRLSKANLSAWSLKNQVLQDLVFTILVFVSITIFASVLKSDSWLPISLFLLGQSAIAILSLESVNYIEHYGILRKKISDSRYERVNPLHSWNSNHSISNLMLFQLQRHSDHHANASKPYQILNHIEESPQLPYGYPLMIMLALAPRFFFKKINPILESWESKRLSLVIN